MNVYVILVHDPNSSDPAFVGGVFADEDAARQAVEKAERERDMGAEQEDALLPDADAWAEVVGPFAVDVAKKRRRR